jgi:hypothetical protein
MRGEKVVNTDADSSKPGREIEGGEILWWPDGHN